MKPDLRAVGTIVGAIGVAIIVYDAIYGFTVIGQSNRSAPWWIPLIGAMICFLGIMLVQKQMDKTKRTPS